MGSKNLLIVLFLGFIFVVSGVLGAQRVIDLDKVWGDMRVLGKYTGTCFGFAVAYGDINGDGFMDIIIGAFRANPGGRNEAGEIYVILGNSSPKSTIDLNSSQADITIYGDDENGWFGQTSASGDINGDGFDDIIIGAPNASPDGRADAGKTYVIFGSDFPSPPYTIDLSTDQADITVFGNDELDHTGRGVASGDVNGDGIDDIIIGAFYAEPPGGHIPGATYVIFGSSSPPSNIDLDTQSADITVYGDDACSVSGIAVASGDVNGDDYDDIIIGAPWAYPGDPPRSHAGETYVIFGSSFSSPPYTIDLSKESADITVCGDDAGDNFGHAVACGDINGDGYDDIIISANGADPFQRLEAGETYVIFGSSSPPSTLDLSTESADITICGAAAADNSGCAVASGDINGDGYDDLIIGASLVESPKGDNSGATYVVFGANFTPPVIVDLRIESADITIYGDDDEDRFGGGLASGDINGDGYSDMIIGAPKAFWIAGAGETYVIFGGGPLIASHGLGGKSWIKEFDIFGNSIRSFKAFGAVNSQGEVHLAISDIDKDGHDEIAAGQGEGGKSWVKFFEVDGSPISGFKAFGASNTNGELHLAIGNFDVEPSDNEIAVAQGEGGQSWVKLFNADGTLIRSFKAFGSANAQGEVHLAAGDLDKNGVDEIIAGMGEGGSSRVKIFNRFGSLIRSFLAFDATDNPGGEVRLAVGNFDADPAVEIAVSTGYNGGNKVRLFDKNGTSIGEFTAFGFGGNTNGDVQIAAADIDNDGIDEVICGHGEGGSSMVKVFKADGTFIRSFKAFGAVNAQGEVHLGKSNY